MSLAPSLILDTYSIGRTTQTAGTAIVVLVPPRRYKKTKVTLLSITSGATQHTWYWMKELGRTTLYSAAAGGATSLVLTKDPGLYTTNAEYANRGVTPSQANNAIATTDYIVVQMNDGIFVAIKPSGVSTDSTTGRVTLTVSAIGAAGIAAGSTVWFMGAPADVDPHTGLAPSVQPGTSATTLYPNAAGMGGAIVTQSEGPFSPIILYNANASAASVLDNGSAVYGD